jgi:hypothetical protein
MHREEPRTRILVAAAMLNAERGPEAFALLEPLSDELDEAVMPFLVDAAIRAGDMDAAVAAFRRVAEIHSDLGRMADLGLRLLEWGQASARAEALEHAASQRPTIAPWFAGQREQPRTARESGWEGPHRRTSRVLDEASFGRVH